MRSLYPFSESDTLLLWSLSPRGNASQVHELTHSRREMRLSKKALLTKLFFQKTLDPAESSESMEIKVSGLKFLVEHRTKSFLLEK